MILIDTSVWIEFFKANPATLPLNDLIDRCEICTNDVILAELRPLIISKKQYDLDALLNEVLQIPLCVDWQGIVDMQVMNIKNGINKVGIPDLIIVQNALQNRVSIWTLDKHFLLMSSIFKIELYRSF